MAEPTPAGAEQFAREWAEAWNQLDVERVLAHFADAVMFTSPKAVDAVGTATVVGKEALRSYWRLALARIHRLHFKVVRVLWDPGARTLVIIYDREVNGLRDRAAEILETRPDGLVVRGEVFYGLQPAS
jgi:hypothetical protein